MKCVYMFLSIYNIIVLLVGTYYWLKKYFFEEYFFPLWIMWLISYGLFYWICIFILLVTNSGKEVVRNIHKMWNLNSNATKYVFRLLWKELIGIIIVLLSLPMLQVIRAAIWLSERSINEYTFLCVLHQTPQYQI